MFLWLEFSLAGVGSSPVSLINNFLKQINVMMLTRKNVTEKLCQDKQS